MEVTLSGARLGDAQELIYYQAGITTVSLKKVDANNVKAKIKIAPDCALGLHDLRLRTATGLSELRTFSVGAMKEVSEVEPNNDFAVPQPIPMDVTVNGVADNEDVDYFVVEAKKGERISVEVEGLRLGISEFDPYVAILNAKRFELGSSDDAALIWRDGFTSIIAPEDGKYIVQVRESAYAGNGGCLYRLHVGHFPRATAIVPAGAKPGETVKVRWIGDPAGENTSTIKLPAAPDRDFGIQRQDDKGFSPFPNPFRLTPLGNVMEKEPNDDQAHATPFQAPMALNGVIEKPGDTDQFVFKAAKGQVFDIHCYARRIRSPLDSVMYLCKKGGGPTVGADDSFGPDSYFRFPAPETAEYVIWVVDQLAKGGPDYSYRIEVTPVVPQLTMTTNAEQIPLGTGVMGIAVPKGNRQAILIFGNRADFGGDLNVGVSGLPAGVNVEAPTIVASQAVVPVLFSAKPDAALAATLAEVSGKPVDAKLNVPSRSSSSRRSWCWARITSTSGRARSIAWRSPSSRNALTRSRSSSPRCPWSAAARWD